MQTFEKIIPTMKASFDRTAQRSSAPHAATNTQSQTAGQGDTDERGGRLSPASQPVASCCSESQKQDNRKGPDRWQDESE